MPDLTYGQSPPQPPFRIEINAHGDTWADALRQLEEAFHEVNGHGPECAVVSGGGGGGHWVRVTKRPVSKEDYRAELDAWHEERKRAR